ncbi:MAG: T9SS type A sorting domain-containing protein [Chitinophagaceae bacterium]|nr:T9SS type A sorting domain-containing protein [Chitinophagaceae bacterium]
MKIIFTLLLSIVCFSDLKAQCVGSADDCDGDGILNGADMDNDNDGIPDLQELSGSGTMQWTNTQISSFQTTPFTASLACGTPVTFQCTSINNQVRAFAGSTSPNFNTVLTSDLGTATTQPRSISFGTYAPNSGDIGTFTLTFSPGQLYELNLYFSDPEVTSFYITVYNASNDSLPTIDWSVATYETTGTTPASAYPANTLTMAPKMFSFTAPSLSNDYDVFRLRLGFVTLLQASKIIIRLTRNPGVSTASDGVWFFLAGKCSADTDADGIYNHFDTDSDGDGCPDALEGNGTFKYPGLDVNGRLNVPVDASGVPVIAGVPQTVGTSANAALFDVQSACAFPETYAVSINQPGMPAVLNLGSNPLQGSDEADQPVQDSWAAKKLIITALPTNGFDLIYNGSTVTQNQVISPYVANLLSIQPGPLTPEGINSTTFQYSTVDAADQEDQTPASYTITWAQALPLHLVNFSAYYNNQCQLEFKWASENEINFSGYTIEKSSDGKLFTAIGNVQGKGEAKNTYTYIQNALNETYFRLRMTDIDGTITYSKTIYVNNKCGVQNAIRLFPVPAGNMVMLTGLNAGDRIIVYNNTGNVLISATNISGSSKTINIQSLPSGIYTMRIISVNGNSKTIKMIKQF